MTQLDGSCESKVTTTTTLPPTPYRTTTKLSRKDTQHRPSARERFANLFTPKKRASTSLSNLTINDYEPIYDNSPMRILSPRETDLELQTSTAKAKHRTFSFKKRQSYRESKEPITAADTAQLTLSEALNEGRHVPVTDAPCLATIQRDSMAMGGVGLLSPRMNRDSVAGLPVRRDSVAMGGAGMPGSPTKEAALTSHPIIKVEVAESESSNEFSTPISRRSFELGKG